jgi:hypothetical protein
VESAKKSALARESWHGAEGMAHIPLLVRTTYISDALAPVSLALGTVPATQGSELERLAR